MIHFYRFEVVLKAMGEKFKKRTIVFLRFLKHVCYRVTFYLTLGTSS